MNSETEWKSGDKFRFGNNCVAIIEHTFTTDTDLRARAIYYDQGYFVIDDFVLVDDHWEFVVSGVSGRKLHGSDYTYLQQRLGRE